MTAGDEDDCLMNGFSGSFAQRLAQSLSPAIVGMGAAGARSAARMPPRGRTWAGMWPPIHSQDEAPGAVQRQAWGLAWRTSTDRLGFPQNPVILGSFARPNTLTEKG